MDMIVPFLQVIIPEELYSRIVGILLIAIIALITLIFKVKGFNGRIGNVRFWDNHDDDSFDA
jgi:uncharacterized phage infection (PIP) family protein YhgE